MASSRNLTRATDSSIALYLLGEFHSLQIGIFLTEELHYGFAVPRGSSLREALSEHIVKLKASGLYYLVLERYLGAKAVEVITSGRAR